MKGRLITIEGIDGSGKGTQTDMLVSALIELGYSVRKYTFPTYGQSFYGKLVGEFLNGDYGTLEQVHPKLASLTYAGDRLGQRERMMRDLEAGEIIICDRYVESSMAHQGAKIENAIEAQAFAKWIYNLEYRVNGLPEPDLTLYLDIPPHHAAELVLKKKQREYTDKKEDIHEANKAYMSSVYEAYRLVARDRMMQTVHCVSNENQIRTIEDISKELVETVNTFLTRNTSR